MNCPNQSKLTQYCCEKWNAGKPTLTPTVTEKHIVVTIIEHMNQSQPSPTIHYTYDETLDIGSLEVVWNPGINPNIPHLGAKRRVLEPKLSTTHNSKACLWRWLYVMNSNLNLAKPFNILMVREWKGWDAVNCPNQQSKLTQSWCEKWNTGKTTLTHPVT